jgi:hypothetical protein
MKSRFDSIIAACIISIVIGVGLTGAYALNDTSGVPSTGNGNGAPIAVASPDPTITVDGTEEVITELPATGSGPTTIQIKVGAHTGWHFTGVYSCDWLGRQMALYQWYVYSGYHYSAGAPIYSWQYTGRWC